MLSIQTQSGTLLTVVTQKIIPPDVAPSPHLYLQVLVSPHILTQPVQHHHSPDAPILNQSAIRLRLYGKGIAPAHRPVRSEEYCALSILQTGGKRLSSKTGKHGDHNGAYLHGRVEHCHQLRDLSLIHISEPTRRTPISYAVFCLKKKKKKKNKPPKPRSYT